MALIRVTLPDMSARLTCRSWQELPAWGTATVPPTSFRIFQIGLNTATMFPGRRVSVYLSATAAAKIVEEWARRGIAGCFDYGHAVDAPISETGGDVPSAGWFTLEARADGLWAVDIKWTPKMVAHFAAKEYRYTSPFFATEQGKDGQHNVTALLNIAITNYPATDNQRPLIALSRTARRYTMLDAAAAKALASKIITALSADEALTDSIALLLMEGETAPAEGVPPAEEMPMAEAAPEESMVAQAAFKAVGTTNAKEAVGALSAFAAVRGQRDALASELRLLKHTAAVDAAISARKLTPAKRAEALAADPDVFKGAMLFASAVVDTAVLTPPTLPTKVEPKAAINADMRAYCAKHGKTSEADVEAFAATYVAKFGAEKFTL